jgi:N-acetylglucosaminyl-diphospho-decaprenol L-rhamnosyltransferase
VPALALSYSGLLGGAERMLLDVATGLPDPPLLACPDGPLAQTARERGLGVFELQKRSLELRRSPRDRTAMPLRIAAQAAEIRELVKSQQPEAMLAWGMRAGLVLATAYPLRHGRPPWLLQHHDLLPSPLVARAVRAAAARADIVAVCSQCVAEDLDPDGTLPTQLIPLGVDLTRFQPPPTATPTTPATSTAANPQQEVLVLGAIERWKRPDLALEAVARATARVPDLRLRLVGAPIGQDGQRLLSELRTRAESEDLAGRVEFTGPLPDPCTALHRAACLLHCADREPYGAVIAEALASGLPVVAPDSCGPAEIVDHRCARLFAPGDPASAAAALELVLSDESVAAQMAKAGRARAEQRLDLQDTRARYEEVVAQLTAAGTTSRPGRRPSPTAPRRHSPGETLAIVTVIHQSKPELTALLNSIERHLPAAQVVVVDSGSTDGGLAVARAWRDGHAEAIDLKENAGFGRGVNAGLNRVKRPIAALLNPDVELLDASLDAAARELARNPTRLLAPLVLQADRMREDSAQHSPGTALLALHALSPGTALPPKLASAVEPWRGNAPRRVGWAVGCAVLAGTDTLRRLGPFDERVFLYGEDLDLGLRATDAGLETWFWPAARVLHRGAHSTRQAFGGEPLELLVRRRQAVVAERRGRGRALADHLLQRATFADRMLLKLLVGRDAARERRQLEAQRR